ncbi:MAG: hypothetical protein WC223_10615 [Bacteroidales bacterium]|jgi:hypothetical protein
MIKSPETTYNQFKQEFQNLFQLYKSGNLSEKNLLVHLSDLHKRFNSNPEINLQVYFKNQKKFKYRGDILHAFYKIVLYNNPEIKAPNNQREAVAIKIKELLALKCSDVIIAYDNRKKYKNPIIAKYIGTAKMCDFLNERI